MNKLIIPPGGMPFTGDDLLYLQNNLRDGFANYLSNLTGRSDLILSNLNLEINGQDYSWDDCYVLINGEVLFLPEGTAVDALQKKLAITIDISYDPAGNDVFADQVSKDTYEIRQAKMVVYETNDPDPTDGLLLTTNGTAAYLWNAEQAITTQNGWVSLSAYMRKRGNLVYLTGGLSTGTTGSQCFQINSWKPSFPINQVIHYYQDNAYHLAHLEITTSGNVFIRSDSPLVITGTLYLSGVQWVLD